MVDIHDQCRNRWRSILPLFDVGQDYLTGKQTACPICNDGKDRFRFDDKEGRGTWICNVCGAGNGVDMVMKVTSRSFAQACAAIRERLAETTTSPPPRQIDPARAADAVKARWESGVPLEIDGHRDMAVEYLISRGLVGPYPMRLRFCAECSVKGHPTKSVLPAMLALVSGPDGRPVNVHRTYLENGAKAAMDSPRKIMAGTLPDGSAVRLGEPLGGRLGVAEGIETALAVTQRFGVPCWSALNSTMLGKFIVPPRLREFHIFGDNDRKFGGQAAAYHLAHRASTMREGPQIVVVHIPQRPGTDWADFPEKWRKAAV
jgi:putative DNA primase/helicase